MKAQRIHDAERLAKKRSKYNGHGVVALQTPAVCSCWMCGNPRKWFKQPTIQERRLMQEIPA